MTDADQPSPPIGSRLAIWDARYGPFFGLLGVVFLLLVLLDLLPLPLSTTEQRVIRGAEVAIYALFVLEFVTRWSITDDKRRFLRRNWFNLLTLALPMLRPVAALRAIPILRSSQALTGLALSHRGLIGLRQLTRGRQLAYMVSLTTIVVLFAAGTVFYIEHAVRESPFTSFSEAVWWAATLVTTINSSDDPVTALGRVIALGVRVYAVSVFSLITASVATWLIGLDAPAANEAARQAGDPENPRRKQ